MHFLDIFSYRIWSLILLRSHFHTTQARRFASCGACSPDESGIRFGRGYAFVHAQYQFQSLVTLIFITRSVDFRRVPSRIQAQSSSFLRKITTPALATIAAIPTPMRLIAPVIGGLGASVGTAVGSSVTMGSLPTTIEPFSAKNAMGVFSRLRAC